MNFSSFINKSYVIFLIWALFYLIQQICKKKAKFCAVHNWPIRWVPKNFIMPYYPSIHWKVIFRFWQNSNGRKICYEFSKLNQKIPVFWWKNEFSLIFYEYLNHAEAICHFCFDKLPWVKHMTCRRKNQFYLKLGSENGVYCFYPQGALSPNFFLPWIKVRVSL